MVSTRSVDSGNQIVEDVRSAFEKSLEALELGLEPVQLYEPARYILASGGKRLRPTLLLLTAQSYGASLEEAMPGALAVETFHNFTLVHDDIMDHALTRRGRDTVHVKWDESTAILAGDYLMALSFDLLTQLQVGDLRSIVSAYHNMVRRLCEGQAYDKAFESQREVSLEEYLIMIEGKTGALIETVFVLGGMIGGADRESLDVLRKLGMHVGRAFQIQDDLLDLVADDQKWGKKVGGDLIEGKKTYLLLKALSSTEGEARTFFQSIIEKRGLPENLIPKARAYMEEYGVINASRDAVISHTRSALGCLEIIPDGPSRKALYWLIEQLQMRLH